MKKTFILEDLGCANCAAKMETAIAKLAEVDTVQVNFMRSSMVLEAEDAQFETALKKAKKIIRKIEPDVSVLQG